MYSSIHKTDGDRNVQKMIVLAFFFASISIPQTPAFPQMRLATWNIEHLGTPGQGCLLREQSDFEAIRKYVKSLDADIIALQEIASIDAARLVFPENEYELILSERPISGNRPYCWGLPPQTLGDLRTGFAVRNGIEFQVNDEFTLLGNTTEGPNTMPWGVDITISTSAGSLRLLSVHLASGCAYSCDQAVSACRILFSQISALQNWIQSRESSSQNYGVLGDFNRVWSRDDRFFEEALSNIIDEDKLFASAEIASGSCYSIPEAIDHILLRFRNPVMTFSSEVVDIHRFDYKNYKISDHCPVVVSF